MKIFYSQITADLFQKAIETVRFLKMYKYWVFFEESLNFSKSLEVVNLPYNAYQMILFVEIVFFTLIASFFGEKLENF